METATTVTIRKAGREDAPVFLELVQALADYEHLTPPDAEAQARLLEDGFGPQPRFEAYLAELDGAAVGYAIVCETYSNASFSASPTLYLEDLFVRPEARRRGAGQSLLRFLANEALARGCGRMEWMVLDWNELAQGVYRRIGANIMEEWRLCRLTGAALEGLARGE
jgi:GNAT superfamily N-acetyltransferase